MNAQPYRTIRHGAEYMHLYENGTISRPAINMKASGKWQVIGAVTLNNFGYAVKFYSLADVFNNPGFIEWQHKNGKQKTFIRDLDHGTMREWRSPNHSVF